MKFYLLSSKIYNLNIEGEIVKLCNYFKGLYHKVHNICLQKHKLHNDKAINIGRQL